MSSLVFNSITGTLSFVDTVGFDVYISASSEAIAYAHNELLAEYTTQVRAVGDSRAHINLGFGGQILISEFVNGDAVATGQARGYLLEELTTGIGVSAVGGSAGGEAIARAFTSAVTKATGTATQDQPQLAIASVTVVSAAHANTLFTASPIASVDALGAASGSAHGQAMASVGVVASSSVQGDARGQAIERVHAEAIAQLGQIDIDNPVTITDNITVVSSAQFAIILPDRFNITTAPTLTTTQHADFSMSVATTETILPPAEVTTPVSVTMSVTGTGSVTGVATGGEVTPASVTTSVTATSNVTAVATGGEVTPASLTVSVSATSVVTAVATGGEITPASVTVTADGIASVAVSVATVSGFSLATTNLQDSPAGSTFIVTMTTPKEAA